MSANLCSCAHLEGLQQTALDIAVDPAAAAPTALRMTKYLLNSFLWKNQDGFDLRRHSR